MANPEVLSIGITQPAGAGGPAPPSPDPTASAGLLSPEEESEMTSAGLLPTTTDMTSLPSGGSETTAIGMGVPNMDVPNMEVPNMEVPNMEVPNAVGLNIPGYTIVPSEEPSPIGVDIVPNMVPLGHTPDTRFV